MKKRLLFFIAFTAIVVVLIQCKKAQDYPIVPGITFVSAIPSSVSQFADTTSALKVRFAFTDGDGDLGYPEGQTPVGDTTIVFEEIRPNSSLNYRLKFEFPEIPAKGSYDQLTGFVTVNLANQCSCRPDHLINDTVQYNIYVRDRAGHRSNTIATPKIIINCN